MKIKRTKYVKKYYLQKMNTIFKLILFVILACFQIIRVFYISPDVLECDKRLNVCVIKEKPFYKNTYFIKDKISISEITGIAYSEHVRFIPNNLIIYAPDKHYIYNYYSFGICRGNTREQAQVIKYFLSNKSQITLVLEEPLYKSFSVYINFLAFLACIGIIWTCFIKKIYIKHKK